MTGSSTIEWTSTVPVPKPKGIRVQDRVSRARSSVINLHQAAIWLMLLALFANIDRSKLKSFFNSATNRR